MGHPLLTSPGTLDGLKIVEFSHMVMGPACGLVLADLGADVVKIEPAPAGDNTRRLTGVAVGFYATYNRNKRSICLDLKSPEGLSVAKDLIASADVLIENFRPGAMEKLGLGYEALSAINPRLVYCACKGFLPGPYEGRAALDEVVQMMSGLAYMTGTPERPLRAGASVNDVLGGVFGAVAILAALRERERTGHGSLVQVGLFETNMLLMGQHMAHAAIEGRDLAPFGDPASSRPWPLYDVFKTADANESVFVGAVTITQWRDFAREFGLDDLLEDPALATIAQLAAARPRILERVRALFSTMSKADLMARFEALGLPFAPIARPSDLFDDPHLLASGGLLETDMTTSEGAGNGFHRPLAGIPGLPVVFDDARPGLRRQPPVTGEHSLEVAREAGLTDVQIEKLIAAGVMRGPKKVVRESV